MGGGLGGGEYCIGGACYHISESIGESKIWHFSTDEMLA